MNNVSSWLVLPVVVILVGLGLVLWRWFRVANPRAQLLYARESFRKHRTQLQALFFQAAAASGKPRGLRWKECAW